MGAVTMLWTGPALNGAESAVALAVAVLIASLVAARMVLARRLR